MGVGVGSRGELVGSGCWCRNGSEHESGGGMDAVFQFSFLMPFVHLPPVLFVTFRLCLC